MRTEGVASLATALLDALEVAIRAGDRPGALALVDELRAGTGDVVTNIGRHRRVK